MQIVCFISKTCESDDLNGWFLDLSYNGFNHLPILKFRVIALDNSVRDSN